VSRPRAETPSLFDLGPPAGRAPGAGLLVQVALNRPMRREYTYAVPERLAGVIAAGSRVAVPLGSSRQVGVVVGTDPEAGSAGRRLREVLEVLDPEPIVDRGLLALTRWIAERYASSWGEALAAVLPAPLKRERGTRKVALVSVAPGVGREQLTELEDRFPKQHRLLRTLLDAGARLELRDVLRRLQLSESPARSLERRGWVRIELVEVLADALLGGASSGAGRARPERLSPAQEAAVAEIGAAIEERSPASFLLEGVTGSGKTEVYLRAIELALARGRGAIVLVPEIALTPQTVGWFRSRFGDVAVLHSRMTDAQRLAMWLRLKRGEARVVVGARSAVFAPLDDVGVIVVDEEHEPSFKQASVPRYHAREVALERARRADAVCILGSATPSLESWHDAGRGELRRLRLPERVGGGRAPTVDIVDMRLEREERATPLFSRTLAHLLAETVAAGEQAILFLNRRGFVPVLWCPGCETTVRCEQCDVGLTYHRRIKRLVCHSCCEERPVVTACPSCSRPGLRFFGVGSERVEAELARLVPGVRVRRMDSDTMHRREDYETVLEAFGRGELDVLVGTQMIAKGLDFPRVTLVGIVLADQALHLPDFRASERTFQLIAQVAGRAGRAELPGRIVVQTGAPEHPAIQLAAAGDFESFARAESKLRRELGYPPHGRLLRVLLEGEDERRVAETADVLAERLATALGRLPHTLLGPAPAPLALLRGRHRHHLVLKTPATPAGDTTLTRAATLAADLAPELRLRVTVDVDPMSML